MGSSNALFGGNGISLFDPAKAYTIGEAVVDASDAKVYFKRTAAGAVSTVPRLNYTDWRQDGFPSSIISKTVPQQNVIGHNINTNAGPFYGDVQASSGVYASSTHDGTGYKAMLNLSGRGVIDFFAGASNNDNACSYRLTIDDVVLYTAAGVSTVSNLSVDAVIGALAVMNSSPSVARGIIPEEIFFSRNFKIEVANSISSGSYVYGFRSRLLA